MSEKNGNSKSYAGTIKNGGSSVTPAVFKGDGKGKSKAHTGYDLRAVKKGESK